VGPTANSAGTLHFSAFLTPNISFEPLMVHHINEKTILVIVFFVYAIEYVIRGEEPGGRDRRETVRWTVEQGAFEAGLNEAGERDPTRAKGEAAGSP